MPLTPRVALVADALAFMGGAEKVLMTAMELFPVAPVYCLIYHRAAFQNTPLASRQVVTSYLQCLPLARKHYRKYLPLMPHAIEQFDLSPFDLVISFNYAVAQGVRVQAGQIHISYIHTPMRYAWRDFQLNGAQSAGRNLLYPFFHFFRRWDKAASDRVTRFAAVSQSIVDAVRAAYQRPSVIIHPPVEIERFHPQLERSPYYVTVSRLVAHKRLDLVIDTFNQLKLPLLVIGEGPERARLEKRAGETIKFLGFVPDPQVAVILSQARGFICAAEEDFGIAVVEAQAAGCPVIAFHKGGALETIQDGQTGLFFDRQCVESLTAAVAQFESRLNSRDNPFLNPLQIAASVQRFNRARFLEEFARFALPEKLLL